MVLNKSDMCAAGEEAAAVAAIRAIAPDVPVHATSCVRGQGIDRLAAYLAPGRTVALLGSSGVGKSSIINHLLGSDRQQTRRVHRRTRRGQHTTVHRELLLRPGGGVIIDTPGMRELQLWDSGRALEAAFDDVDALAADCRFRDCSHRSEPGCAVRAAVADGQLAAARLHHFHRLADERAALRTRQEQLDRNAEARRTRPDRAAARAPRRLSSS